MALTHGAEVLSWVPKYKKAVMYPIENVYMLDKLPTGVSYSSVFTLQQRMLNIASLNKSTHQTRLHIDQGMEML